MSRNPLQYPIEIDLLDRTERRMGWNMPHVHDKDYPYRGSAGKTVTDDMESTSFDMSNHFGDKWTPSYLNSSNKKIFNAIVVED